VRRVRATIFEVEKAVSITYSDGVFVALGIQHGMCMCRIFICVACPAVKRFLQYLINGTFFEKKTLLTIKCVF